MQISLLIGVLEPSFDPSFDRIHAVFHFYRIEESMLMHCPVCVFFQKIIKPLEHISKSEKCGVSFSDLSVVNLRFLSNPLNDFNTLPMLLRLTSNNVS